MRKLRYSVAMTLDGFIADPNGGYDWIIMDESIDFEAMFREFDTFVMGRKTFEVSAPTEFMSMFGGGVMFRTLVDAGLVDTIEVAIMPVLLAEGLPVLPQGARVAGMKLEKCETLPGSGIVMLSYALPQK